MRKLVVSLVLLVVLAGAFFAADRVAHNVAQNEIAKKVAAQYELNDDPEVSIKGFPFLTQAIGGEYHEIDIDVGDVTQQGVTLTGTAVALKDVRAPLSDAINGDPSAMVADTAISTATVGYDDVNKEAPNGMKVSPQGSKLRIRGPVQVVPGLTRNVTATVTVRATGGTIRVVPQSVETNGTAVPMDLVRRAFTFTVPVHGLPLGTRISGVDVRPDGLRVSAVTHHVKLADLTIH